MRGRKASGTACKRCATCHTFAECRTCRSRRSRGLVRFSYGPAIFYFWVSGFGFRTSGLGVSISAVSRDSLRGAVPPSRTSSVCGVMPPRSSTSSVPGTFARRCRANMAQRRQSRPCLKPIFSKSCQTSSSSSFFARTRYELILKNNSID